MGVEVDPRNSENQSDCKEDVDLRHSRSIQLKKAGQIMAKLLCAVLLIAGILPAIAFATSNDTVIDLTDTSVTSGANWSASYNTRSKTWTYTITGNVEVIGSISNANKTLNFVVDPTATVSWKCPTYTGVGIDNSLITVSGGGSFVVEANTWLIHNGSGRGISAPGENNNSKIIVDGGTIQTGSGAAIYMEGLEATVEVRSGAVMNNGTIAPQAAIYMRNESAIGTNVIVSGTGRVWSLKFDGDGVPVAIQSYGSVEVTDQASVRTDHGRAINALGSNSVVTIGGEAEVFAVGGIAVHTDETNAQVIIKDDAYLYNEEGDGANYPVILMENGTASSVTVQDSAVVETYGENGWAINTPGNVIVSDNAQVKAVNGRAISATGALSEVSVSGGQVSAVDGVAIQVTEGTARVSAGQVYAQTGTAIKGSNGAEVFVSDAGSGGPGGQVWIKNNGAAIDVSGAGSSVSVDGGFVFAYGNDYHTAITAGNILWPDVSGGVVTVWGQSDTAYVEGTQSNLNTCPAQATAPDYSVWHNDATLGGGITYTNTSGATAGFFPLADVYVTENYGLIFDVASGILYQDADGDGLLNDNGSGGIDNPIFSGSGWSATQIGGQYELSLADFKWSTNAPIALSIVDGSNLSAQTAPNASLRFSGENTLFSGYNGIDFDPATYPYVGLYSQGSVTVVGANEQSSLLAIASASSSYVGVGTFTGINVANALSLEGGLLGGAGRTFAGYIPQATGIDAGSLIITEGYVQAGVSGSHSDGTSPKDVALAADLADAQISLPTAYSYMQTNTAPTGSPSDYTEYTPVNGNLAFSNANPDWLYVEIKAYPFALIEDTTIDGTKGTALASQETATVNVFGNVSVNLTSPVDASNWFSNLPAGITVSAVSDTGNPNKIIFSFSGVPLVPSTDLLDVTLPASILSTNSALKVALNPAARFNIAPAYALSVASEGEGSVPEALNGMYRATQTVQLNAVPEEGYHFVRWTVKTADGSTLVLDSNNPRAALTMPAIDVEVIAIFEANSSGGSESDNSTETPGSGIDSDNNNSEGKALAMVGDGVIVYLFLVLLLVSVAVGTIVLTQKSQRNHSVEKD